MKKILMLFFALGTLISCKESIWNAPPTEGETPSPVKNFTVKNLNGKSVIHFTVPDNNALYVVAEYKLANGESKNVKASRFTDSIVVDGFSKAQDYEVKLYAVGGNEQKSEPVTVVVTPKTPTYITAFQTVNAFTTFGGITVTASNPSREALVIETMRKGSDGIWVSLDRFYTSTDNIRYSIRGLPSESQDFAVFVRDRWLNYSDTLEVSITPRVEIQIPPANITEISAAVMPGSAPFHNNSSTYNAKKIVDGNFGNYYLTLRGGGVPQHANYDFKTTYNLSRIIFHQREGYYYRGISPRKIKIWGSMNPAADGSFNGWTLLGEFEIIKPSGLPMDTNSEEDNTTAAAGHNFDFENTNIPVRYVRFQTMETWELSDYITARECEFFGNLVP